jgi:hypothetical protein
MLFYILIAAISFVLGVVTAFAGVIIGKSFALRANHIDENAQVDEVMASLEAHRAMERDLFATN